MQKNPGDERPQWIPLREACLILGVNETTLRYWADGGKVRAFRTPGGHRRFSIADLHAITQGNHSAHPPLGDHVLGEAALMRIRRRLQQSRSSKVGWVDAAGEKGRLRLRPLGRRLLHLVGDYLRQRRGRVGLLEEARAIGAEHGEEAAHLGLGFKDAFQAFVFFRNSVLDMIAQVTLKRRPGLVPNRMHGQGAPRWRKGMPEFTRSLVRRIAPRATFLGAPA